MKKVFISALAFLFLVAITGVSLSHPAYAFWYGDMLSSHVSSSSLQGLHDYIVNNILKPKQFQQSLRGVDNNPNSHEGVTIYDDKKAWNGYTLLNSLGGHAPDPSHPDKIYGAILIDMDGNLVKEWYLNGAAVKMLPGGYVLGAKADERPAGGGRGMPYMQQLDWCGNEVWKYDPRPGVPVGADMHHDFQREGNPVGYYAPSTVQSGQLIPGKTLILAHAYPLLSETLHISNFPLLDDKIYEIDWMGNVLWEWYAHEHFDKNGADLGMGFHEAAKSAVANVRVGGGPGVPLTDWQHFNNANYLGPNKWYDQGDLRFHPDNIIWDGRSSNIMAIISRHDHPEGKWKSGDIVWRVGPHFSAGYKEQRLGQIIGLHHAHMIPRSLPGAGNILVFDNGGFAGFDSIWPGMPGYYPATYRNYSRIIEFDPITLEIVWEYKKIDQNDEDGDGQIKGNERKFYSNLISSAQRLKNGNTLITEGHGGRIFEVTVEGEVVWEYISQYAAGAAPNATDPNAVYRAYRIPYSWVPYNPKCR